MLTFTAGFALSCGGISQNRLSIESKRHPMNLQQLKCVVAIAQNDLNVTAAALALKISQPAVSRQIGLLEEELGVRIFGRTGRNFSKVSDPGERVIAYARQILRDVHSMKAVADEFRDEGRGILSIGTTHTQARYLLPDVIQRFRHAYPEVQLHLHQGTPDQIAEMANQGLIDLAIATESRDFFKKCILLPCYQWRRQIVVPIGHPLAKLPIPTLADLAQFPILSYEFDRAGPLSLLETFRSAGLAGHVALTARDSDVIKTYVRLGMGVGIVASVSLHPTDDADLVKIDASHLFALHTTWIGFMRDSQLRGFVYDFVVWTAPHLTRPLVDRAAGCESQEEVDSLLSKVDVPLR
jgi:LysR family transcriptional regulator, cys regulon transcriptional activator